MEPPANSETEKYIGARSLRLATGKAFSEQEANEVSERTLALERAFLCR
jgi:hypothetical protein